MDKQWLPSPQEVDEYMESRDCFKVIVAGGRSMNNYELLCRKLDHILSDKAKQCRIQIVSGTANGADALGERYAKERGFSIAKFPAPWEDIEGKPPHSIGTRRDGKKYWKAAGHHRNDQMADYADALVAFWDGESSGTKNMIGLAEGKELKVAVVRY